MTVQVTLEIDDNIGWLRLNTGRPRNAVTRTALDQLGDHIERLRDTNLSVLVIGGTDTCFSNGADLPELAAMDAPAFEGFLRDELALYRAVEGLDCATVAALRGDCIGMAAELALACDFRVAASSIRFAYTEVKLGFAAPTERLYAYLGRAGTADLLLSGRSIRGVEAYELGLLTALVEESSFTQELTEFVSRMARLPKDGVRATKQRLRKHFPFDQAAEEEVIRRATAEFGQADVQQALQRATAAAAKRSLGLRPAAATE